MKYLITTMVLLATFAAAGQTVNPFPYNPDADADGWISVNDLLSLLSIFTTEFTPESWETDSLSAAVVLNGNISYFECQRACHELEGHWRMADMDAFGKHWNLVDGVNANHWVNSNSSLGSHDYNEFCEINGNGSIYSVNSVDLSQGKKCMCHLQSSPFVPDVFTSETAGLQEQIDSLSTQQSILTDMLSSIDSIEASSGSMNQFSLECVEIGVAPLCSEGSAVVPETSNDDYSYSLNAHGSSTVTTNTVSPNWRKFCLSSESYSEDTLAVALKSEKYNSFEGGSWTPSWNDVILEKNLNGEYCFYLYARGGSGNSSGCTGEWDVNEFFTDAPALQAKGYSSGCYCTWTWRHVEILLRENGFHKNSGVRFGIE